VATSPRPLPPPEVESRLRAQFGDDVAAFEDQDGHSVVTVGRDRYREMVRFLHDEPGFACDYCDFTAGVDFGDDGIEVVTHLHSTLHDHNVRLKVKLLKDDLVCPTISDLFPTADWHERETMEMFGVSFQGHPQPVKLLLPEPFEGHPLRKDFPLMTREAKPWPGAVEGEEGEEEEEG
jgi:NADH-quinone oxidoreductase subunit C